MADMWVYLHLANGHDVGWVEQPRLDAFIGWQGPFILRHMGGDEVAHNMNAVLSMKKVDEATARRMAKQFGHQPAGVTAGYDEEGF